MRPSLHVSLCVAAFLLSHFRESSADAATPPTIDFDIPIVVSCKDVTPSSFAATNPKKKLVEVKLDISTRLLRGSERDLEDVTYCLSMGASVIDFLPKTEIGSDINGLLSIVEETKSGVNAAVKVGYATASATAGAEHTAKSQVSYTKLPAKELIVSAGKTDGSRTVTFSMRPFSQATLVGTKQFALVCEVDSDWRGSIGNVFLTSTGFHRGAVFDSRVAAAMRCRVFLIHLEGDTELKGLGEALSDRIRSLNENLSPRMDILQADSVAVLSRPDYSVEADASRGRIASSIVSGLAAYYCASQSSQPRDNQAVGAWQREIKQVEKELAEYNAFGSRSYIAAYRILVAFQCVQDLYNKCFRPSLFDAEEYANDLRQGEDVFKEMTQRLGRY